MWEKYSVAFLKDIKKWSKILKRNREITKNLIIPLEKFWFVILVGSGYWINGRHEKVILKK